MKPLHYTNGDIIKVIARIQHERGFDFGIAPPGRTPESALRDIVAMAKQVSQGRLVRCLIEANDRQARE
jgi:hypothetical protein